MKWPKKLLLSFGVILLLMGAWLGYEATSFLNRPASSSSKEIQFDVPNGATPARIARNLQEKGLIADADKFLLLIRLKNAAGKLQAGRFILNTGWKPGELLDKLVNGKPVLHRITIPEGLTWWQTARLLEDAGFVRFEDFRDVITDPEFLRHYGIPFSSAEGFLMPDTYLMKKPDEMPSAQGTGDGETAIEKLWKDQARAVAGRLIDNFWRKTENLWSSFSSKMEGDGEKVKTNRPGISELKKLVTLASIVEKETGIDAERAKIAGVYNNRLARDMLLQADPTVAYGLGPDFKGPLLRSQLADTKNPYNTYQNPGLPPGPISSFGLAALQAAIRPENHSYLYFVAITDGGEHKFSKTLDQHNLAVQAYRQQKKKK